MSAQVDDLLRVRFRDLKNQTEQYVADVEERDFRDWLLVWNGLQWGDQAPNRLFGSWLKPNGEAT